MLIEKLEATVEQDQWNGVWRLSRAGSCPRAMLAEAYHKPMMKGFASAMKEGNLHEDAICIELAQRGHIVYDRQKELTFSYLGTEYPFIGHIDGYIDIDGIKYLLEIKSAGSSVWPIIKQDFMWEKVTNHYDQVQCYLHASDIADLTSCIYIAKNRSTGEYIERIIRVDPARLEHLAQKFDSVISAYNLDQPAESLPCHENEYVRRNCPFRYSCEQKITEAIPTTPEIDAVANLWRNGKRLEQEANSMLQSSKRELEEMLRGLGVSKAMIAGLTVQIVKRRGSRQVDYEILRQMIGEEAYAKVVSTGDSSEYIKIDGDYQES